ncbi:autotransporter assembly complex family protein [Utexia brackfieldae]|uniref:autotransporter assembly complex protein TamA n=1 Tax=Utexia brackfieldae TaxID=3074108 RepID=UPI00370D1E67
MRIILLLLSLLLCVSFAQAQTLRLQVKGLDGSLEQNVDGRLSTIEANDIVDTAQFRRYVSDEIRKGLRALGYYFPQISFSLNESAFRPALVATVDAGLPILIERVSVNITGQGSKDKDFVELLRKNTPVVGDILNHGVYDAFKNSLLSLAMRKGYFDSEMTRNQLLVSEKLHEAFWNIDFNTGDRYRLGNVTFREGPIRESFLRNIIPFKQGDYYTSEQLSLFSRRLSSTNWFNSVTVLPNINRVGADKEIPIYVVTTPKKQNLIDVGLGYSTDVGVRGKLGWTKPWVNSRGQSFQSNLSLSRVEQTITGSYKIPLEKSPLEDYYTVQGGFKHQDNNDTKADSYTFGVVRYWDSFDGWQKAIGLNTSYDNFTQANSSYNTFLIYPSFNLYRLRQRGGVLPMWGDSQRYALEVANDKLGSDISFWRFTTQQSWLRSLYDTHRFIARANFGYIKVNEFDRVPPSFRYFAGGDRSIRGYSYQSISPKDHDGKLLGASRLLVGSLEYQYNLTGNWWSAVFVDSGEAVDSFRDNDFHTGAGVGLRWVTPIGPVKLDIAAPVDNKGSSSVHFYIGIGAEL